MASEARMKAVRKLATQQHEQAEAKKPAVKPWKARTVYPKLEQNALGEWMLLLKGGAPMPATDAEVALWKALQEAKKRIETLEGRDERNSREGERLPAFG
jgi:hypothetical protein